MARLGQISNLLLLSIAFAIAGILALIFVVISDSSNSLLLLYPTFCFVMALAVFGVYYVNRTAKKQRRFVRS